MLKISDIFEKEEKEMTKGTRRKIREINARVVAETGISIKDYLYCFAEGVQSFDGIPNSTREVNHMLWDYANTFIYFQKIKANRQ